MGRTPPCWLAPGDELTSYIEGIDDQLWTQEDLEGACGLFAWGPPPPPFFLQPDDLAAMMTGVHAPA